MFICNVWRMPRFAWLKIMGNSRVYMPYVSYWFSKCNGIKCIQPKNLKYSNLNLNDSEGPSCLCILGLPKHVPSRKREWIFVSFNLKKSNVLCNNEEGWFVENNWMCSKVSFFLYSCYLSNESIHVSSRAM